MLPRSVGRCSVAWARALMRLWALLKKHSQKPGLDVVLEHRRNGKSDQQIGLGQFLDPRAFEFPLQALPVVLS